MKHTDKILLQYQRIWREDTSTVKVYEKSRRIGISWGEACASVCAAIDKEKGSDTWYIGYNKDMVLEFISDCAKWAKLFNAVCEDIDEETLLDEDKDILAYRIRFKSGHKIVALSSRPANLRGKQGRIVIDEAAFHDDLAGLMKAALATMIWGGKVVIISTHNSVENAFHDLVCDIRAGKKDYSLHRTDFDDAIKQGLFKKVCKKNNAEYTKKAEKEWREDIIKRHGDDADEELFCIPSASKDVFLTRTLVERCMSDDTEVIRYEQKDEFVHKSEEVRQGIVQAWCEDFLQKHLSNLIPNRRCYIGEDFARSGHLTVIIPLQEQQNASFKAPFVLELRNMPFKQQEQILFFIIDRLPYFSFGALDARGNGQYLSEVALQRYGAGRIEQVMLSDKWYRENMPRYKTAFEDTNITLPKDADLIEDHRAIKIIRGIPKLDDSKTKTKNKKARHGDSAIAGALAWLATQQEGYQPITYESVGKRRFGDMKGAW